MVDLETLKSLKEMTGWEISKVDGADVQMVFQGEVIVSFNADKLAQGQPAVVGAVCPQGVV